MFGFFEEVPISSRVELAEESFDYKSAHHLAIIEKRILRFQQAQKILHQVDSNIAKGVMFGSAAWIGCYVFPLVTVSIAAFCFATYHYAHHAEVYKQYHESLNDLIAAYEWSMGRNTGDHWYKFGVLRLQELVLTLGPWVKSETICTWKTKDLEPAAKLSLAKRDNEPSTAFKAKLVRFAAGEQTKEWQFMLYGEGEVNGFWSFFEQPKNKDLVNHVIRNTVLSATG